LTTRKRLKNKYYPEKKEGQEKDELSNFYKKLSHYKYDKTICLDETSIYLNMTSSYGRSKTGTRAIYKTNKYPFKRYNMLCAISANQIVGYVLYKDLKGGVKTQNIIDFYNDVIKDKYKDHLIIRKFLNMFDVFTTTSEIPYYTDFQDIREYGDAEYYEKIHEYCSEFVTAYIQVNMDDRKKMRMIEEYGMRKLIDMRCKNEGDSICLELLNLPEHIDTWIHAMLMDVVMLS
jgi:hypothetical protein